MTIVIVENSENNLSRTTYTFHMMESSGPESAINIVLDSYIKHTRENVDQAYANQFGCPYWSRTNKRDCTLNHRPAVSPEIIQRAREDIASRLTFNTDT